MAITTGTFKEFFNAATPTGFAVDGSSPAKTVLCGFFTASFPASTYDTSAHATLTGVDASISSARRNGKTINILQISGSQPGIYGTTPMGAYSFALSGTNNGTAVFNLSDGTLAAEYANSTAVGAENKPIAFYVLFTEV